MRHTFKQPPCESYCLSVLQAEGRPLMAASFTDLTTKIWDLNKILVQGTGALEAPDCVLKDSVELAPADVGLAGHKLAASSIDGSLRLYDINVSDSGTISTKPLLASGADYNNDAEMMDDQQ